MTFQNHLKEILYRIFYLVLSFFLVFLIIYTKKEKVLKLLVSQVQTDIDLQTIAFFEVFFVQIQLCLSCSFFLFLPFIIYHIWQFMIPALYKSERQKFSRVCFFFGLFTFLSFSFGFFSFPSFLCFLSKSICWPENPYFLIQIRLADFINTYCLTQGLFTIYIAGIFCSFSFLPYIPTKVSKIRPWIFIGFILVSAILSPSDLLAQIAITFLFLIHYEILTFLSFVFKQYLNFMKLKKETHLLPPLSEK